jgi:hypothetical protein
MRNLRNLTAALYEVRVFDYDTGAFYLLYEKQYDDNKEEEV